MGNNDANSDTSKTREAILDAACIVFARHPYNAASIRMIARQALSATPLPVISRQG
jgi:AcrR family transcriptional regulator